MLDVSGDKAIRVWDRRPEVWYAIVDGSHHLSFGQRTVPPCLYTRRSISTSIYISSLFSTWLLLSTPTSTHDSTPVKCSAPQELTPRHSRQVMLRTARPISLLRTISNSISERLPQNQTKHVRRQLSPLLKRPLQPTTTSKHNRL